MVPNLGYDVLYIHARTWVFEWLRTPHNLFDDNKHAFEQTANFQVGTFGAGMEQWRGLARLVVICLFTDPTMCCFE